MPLFQLEGTGVSNATADARNTDEAKQLNQSSTVHTRLSSCNNKTIANNANGTKNGD